MIMKKWVEFTVEAVLQVLNLKCMDVMYMQAEVYILDLYVIEYEKRANFVVKLIF